MNETATDITLNRVICPGSIPDHLGRGMNVFCRIEFDGKRLSITGVEGPKANGDARGSCGQILGGYAHRNPADNDSRYGSPVEPDSFTFTAGWDAELWLDFLDVWERWHLNDMQAACEHQRARGETWTTHPSAECPDCGYRLGSAWLHEDVPADVIEFLRNLPESTREPAWV